MHSVFVFSAIIGGSVLGFQFLLMLLGFDGSDAADIDVDFDDGAGHGHLFFGYLSLKTVVAFLTFFGLAGLSVEELDWGPGVQIGAALAAGFLAFYIVGFVMLSFHRLEKSGTIDLTRGVGTTADVYLVIPEKKTGAGKVTLKLKQRTLQVNAMTDGATIKTGARVRVLGMLDGQTYDVTPV